MKGSGPAGAGERLSVLQQGLYHASENQKHSCVYKKKGYIIIHVRSARFLLIYEQYDPSGCHAIQEIMLKIKGAWEALAGTQELLSLEMRLLNLRYTNCTRVKTRI